MPPTSWSRSWLEAEPPAAERAGGSFAIQYSARGDLRLRPQDGIADEDIVHAVEHALNIGEQDDGKVLYLGPDRASNLLEVVSVLRDDGTGIVIHAMRRRARYEPFLRGEGDSDA